MLVPLALLCFRKERLARLTPLLRVLAYVWLATFAYGFAIAAAVGSINAAVFELVQYLVPMLGGIWLAQQELPLEGAARRLTAIVLPCARGRRLYTGSSSGSSPRLGTRCGSRARDSPRRRMPLPFAMRVFSTLNSPGPQRILRADDAAHVAALAPAQHLDVAALRRSRRRAAADLIREAWVGLLVGTLVYLLMSPRRFAALPALAALRDPCSDFSSPVCPRCSARDRTPT